MFPAYDTAPGSGPIDVGPDASGAASELCLTAGASYSRCWLRAAIARSSWRIDGDADATARSNSRRLRRATILRTSDDVRDMVTVPL